METRYMAKDEIAPFMGKWVEIEFGPEEVLLNRLVYRGEFTGVLEINMMELYLHKDFIIFKHYIEHGADHFRWLPNEYPNYLNQLYKPEIPNRNYVISLYDTTEGETKEKISFVCGFPFCIRRTDWESERAFYKLIDKTNADKFLKMSNPQEREDAIHSMLIAQKGNTPEARHLLRELPLVYYSLGGIPIPRKDNEEIRKIDFLFSDILSNCKLAEEDYYHGKQKN